MDLRKRIKLLNENGGKVLPFEKFLNETQLDETITFEFDKSGTTVMLDASCIDAVWEVIQSECAGNIDNLKKYLANGEDVVISENEIIRHIMTLVDDYINNNVAVRKGYQYVKNLEDFQLKGKQLDYLSCVDTLADMLLGVGDSEPGYIDLIMDIINTDTSVGVGNVGEEEEEE